MKQALGVYGLPLDPFWFLEDDRPAPKKEDRPEACLAVTYLLPLSQS